MFMRRKDPEWQTSPGTSTSSNGIFDPQWESAPSPVIASYVQTGATAALAIKITGSNIDAMMDFGDSTTLRYSRSGMRLRIYVARDAVATTNTYGTGFNRVETNGKFYLLDEFEPTDANYEWDRSVIPDYQRQLKHSTGYYAYQVFPHQDERYELDLRVQRLPKKLQDDQDTPPIQRDAVMPYIELSLYYLCLLDGVDQTGGQVHLGRYNELCRHFRKRYANPGGSVEPVSLAGYQSRFRFGRYSNTS
jgi:hypothetical protein